MKHQKVKNRKFGPKRPLEYHILETSDIEGPFPKFVDKINIKQNTVKII